MQEIIKAFFSASFMILLVGMLFPLPRRGEGKIFRFFVRIKELSARGFLIFMVLIFIWAAFFKEDSRTDANRTYPRDRFLEIIEPATERLFNRLFD